MWSPCGKGPNALEKMATSLRAGSKQEGARTSIFAYCCKELAGTRSPTKHETLKPRGINEQTGPSRNRHKREERDDGGMLTRGNTARLGFGQPHSFDLSGFLLVGGFSCSRLVRHTVSPLCSRENSLPIRRTRFVAFYYSNRRDCLLPRTVVLIDDAGCCAVRLDLPI